MNAFEFVSFLWTTIKVFHILCLWEFNDLISQWHVLLVGLMNGL